MRVPLPGPRTRPSSQPLGTPTGGGGSAEDFGAGVARGYEAQARGMEAKGQGERAQAQGLSNLSTGLQSLAGNIQAFSDTLRKQKEASERFTALRDFSTFQQKMEDELTELKQNADPAGTDFPTLADSIYTERENEFLNALPAHLQDEFMVRSADVKRAVHTDAATFQLKATETYFTDALNDALGPIKQSLGKDGSVENLQNQRIAFDELLETTSLSEAAKVQFRRQAYTMMESVAYKKQVTDFYTDRLNLGEGGSARRAATDLLREFEGGAPGSDSMSFDENQRLLNDRVAMIEQAAVKQIGGLDRWAAMPDRARAGLISVISTEGKLPENVMKAVRSGDVNAIADAVQALGGERHEAEAAIIRGDTATPEAMLDADPRFANVPYEDRLTIREDAQIEAQQTLNAAQAAQKEQNAAQVNALHVALLDGHAGTTEIDNMMDAGILTDVDDIIKARKLRDDFAGGVDMVAEGHYMIQNGIAFNPALEEHRDILNAMVGKEGITAINNKDSEYAANVLVPLVQNAQDIPTDVAGLITTMVHSRDQQEALWALDLAAQLEEASQEGFALRTEAPVASAVNFWRDHKDNWAPEQIMEALQGGTVEQRAQMEALRNEAFDMLSNSQSPAFLTPEFLVNDFKQGFLGLLGPPSMPELGWAARAMESEYRVAFADEYVMDRDIGKAQRRALDLLHRTWEVSYIGGKPTLMKFSPVKAGYPKVAGSHDWIDAQVREELQLPEGSTFQLISDDQTKAEAVAYGAGEGPPPSYIITWTNPDGVMTLDKDDDLHQVRRFFEPGEARVAEEAEYRQRQQEAIRQQSNSDLSNLAKRHSLETGTPIPMELINEFQRDTLERPGY